MSTKLDYVPEKAEDGSVEIFYQPTEELPADIFSKELGGLTFDKHRDYLLGIDIDLSYVKGNRKSLSGGVEVMTKKMKTVVKTS